MKSVIGLILIVLSVNIAHAQLATENNHTGTWSAAGSWSTAQPSPLTTGIIYDGDIDVNGYITREGALTFGNQGNNNNLIIVNDTLVVNGDMIFANNAHGLSISSGGLLVVFGDFEANNKVDLDNGGILVVTGNMILSGGNQDYVGSGDLYVDGTISGNGDTDAADAVDQPSSSLDGGSSGEQSLFDFIQGNGSTSLPITLGAFSLTSKKESIEIEWTTLSEENFDYFEVQRSVNAIDFVTVGIVGGAGNSTAEIAYIFKDHNPAIGTSYYRLSAVDYDGTFEFFEIKSVEYGKGQIGLEIRQNGLGKSIELRINSGLNTDKQEVTLYDLNGSIVYYSVEQSNKILVPVENQMKGLYVFKVRINHEVLTKKFLIN